MIRPTLRAAALICLAAAAPAYAQTGAADAATSVDDPALDPDRDTVTIGVGGVYLPDYEGSDDYRLIPGAAIRGKVSGFTFFSRGLSLYLDLVPEPAGESVDFSVGPVVAGRLTRNSLKSIDEPAVRALGKIDTAIELGGFVGIAKTGVITSDFDTLSARVSYQRDVADAHDSYIITPAIEYGTPLSTRTYVGVSASADYVGDNYAQTYFGVTPGQALASGYPTFSPDGGFKSVNFTLLGAQSLSGDLRRGLALFVLGGYSKLLGDFKRSPLVAISGDSNQYFAAIGIGYTF